MIATTIKKQYLDEIEAGVKRIDFRADNEFWMKKIVGKHHGAILFLSGRRCKAFEIVKIKLAPTPAEAKTVVDTAWCYHIHLGGAYRWPRQIEMFKKEWQHEHGE
jgi:hypothetical protein